MSEMWLVKYFARETFEKDLSKIFVTPSPFIPVYLAADVERVFGMFLQRIVDADYRSSYEFAGETLRRDARRLLASLKGQP